MHCSVKNAAVLWENHRERVTQIWTSPTEEEKEEEEKEEEEEEEEEEDFGHLATFWFGTFVMLLAPLGVLFVTKTLEDEW